MPIRFRCPTCDGVLRIARRKAGTEVTCPKCSRPVVVPEPGPDDDGDADLSADAPDPVAEPAAVAEPVAARPAAARPRVESPLFEQADFERLLGPAADPTPARAAAPPAAPAADPGDGTVSFSRGTLAALAALTAVLIGLAFATGYLVAS